MRKRVNYKYINILLLLLIAYLLFLMCDLWIGTLSKIIKTMLPFFISFLLAYALYPLLKFLTSRKINKFLSVFIIIISIFLIIIFTCYFVFPLLFNQVINLIVNLDKISISFTNEYNLDINVIEKMLNNIYYSLLNYTEKSISNGSLISLLSVSINFISNFIIIFVTLIYFLIDMDKIRTKVKNYLLIKNKKIYNLISKIDKEIYSYLRGLSIFMIIQFFEYTLLFLIIGHPNFLLIGFLASITTVIPYFGGIMTNILALIIASTISNKLFILTFLITIIFSNLDGYVISPKIYNKTNKLPALLTIFVVAIGGALFGIIGIIFAVPFTIILLSFAKAYKSEIYVKLRKIKNIN